MLFAKDTILIKVHHKKETRQTYLHAFLNEISDHYSRERAFIEVYYITICYCCTCCSSANSGNLMLKDPKTLSPLKSESGSAEESNTANDVPIVLSFLFSKYA